MNSTLCSSSANFPLPKKNQAHVWRCDLDVCATANLPNILSADEAARAASFHFPLHRARYIAGRCALRVLLSRYLQQPPESFRFSLNAHGKPELKNRALRFNVSHSKNHALLAFHPEDDIGVDIEFCRQDFDGEKVALLANRFFCDAESRELSSLETEEKRAAFFRCWTRKEALLKATGEGIAGGLKKYQVSLLPDATPGVLAPREETGAWSLLDLSAPPNFTAALAVRATDISVYEMEWECEVLAHH